MTMHPFFFISVFLALVSTAFAGTPNAAARHARDFERAMKEWTQEIQAARGGKAREALWAKRPDANVAGLKVWREIRNDLALGWTLDYAAWIFDHAPEVLAPNPKSRKEAGAIRIRKAVERFHTKNVRVGYYCIALTKLPDPGSMRVLETIERVNPDKRVQGAAALAQAILLRKLDQGGENGIVPKRQQKLRKAVIDGHDLIVGKRKLSSIAQSEIDQLLKFSIGAEAPNLKGVDIALKPFTLEDYRGKVVALFFWHTWMEDAGRSLEIMRKLHQDLQGKNAVILGVNADHAQTLRKMTADGDVPWRNFFDNKRKLAGQYHIEQWPMVFVIDASGKIKYKGSPGSFVELSIEALLDDAQ